MVLYINKDLSELQLFDTIADETTPLTISSLRFEQTTSLILKHGQGFQVLERSSSRTNDGHCRYDSSRSIHQTLAFGDSGAFNVSRSLNLRTTLL